MHNAFQNSPWGICPATEEACKCEIKRSHMSLSVMFVSLSKNPCEAFWEETGRKKGEKGGWGNEQGLLGFCRQNWNSEFCPKLNSKVLLLPLFSLGSAGNMNWRGKRQLFFFFEPKGVEIGLSYLCQATLVDPWINETETQTCLEKTPWISKWNSHFICSISALYCLISVWIESCVWLPCNICALLIILFSILVAYPGYVRTSVYFLCYMRYLKIVLNFVWFGVFVNSVYQTSGFCSTYFFLLKCITKLETVSSKSCVIGSESIESWFSFLLLHLP